MKICVDSFVEKGEIRWCCPLTERSIYRPYFFTELLALWSHSCYYNLGKLKARKCLLYKNDTKHSFNTANGYVTIAFINFLTRFSSQLIDFNHSICQSSSLEKNVLGNLNKQKQYTPFFKGSLLGGVKKRLLFKGLLLILFVFLVSIHQPGVLQEHLFELLLLIFLGLECLNIIKSATIISVWVSVMRYTCELLSMEKYYKTNLYYFKKGKFEGDNTCCRIYISNTWFIWVERLLVKVIFQQEKPKFSTINIISMDDDGRDESNNMPDKPTCVVQRTCTALKFSESILWPKIQKTSFQQYNINSKRSRSH